MKNSRNNQFKFRDKIIQRLKLLLLDDEFVSAIKALHKKWVVGAEFEDESVVFYISSDRDYDGLSKDIIGLRRNYNLSPVFQSFLLSIIVHQNQTIYSCPYEIIIGDTIHEERLLLPKNPLVREEVDENGEAYISIRVFPEITINDINSQWDEAKRLSSRLHNNDPERQYKKENLERDLYINELKTQGKKHAEIAKIVNTDERFSQKSICYQDVAIIINRLKKSAREALRDRKPIA